MCYADCEYRFWGLLLWEHSQYNSKTVSTHSLGKKKAYFLAIRMSPNGLQFLKGHYKEDGHLQGCVIRPEGMTLNWEWLDLG